MPADPSRRLDVLYARPVTLCLAALALALAAGAGTGAHRTFVVLVQILTLAQLVRVLWERRRLPTRLVLIAVLPLTLWMCDVLASGPSDRHAVQNLFGYLAVASAFALIAQPWPDIWRVRPSTAALGIAAISTLVHAAAFALGRPHGTFENPHFLSLHALAVLPIAVHAMLSPSRVRRATGATVALLAAIGLILAPTRVGIAAALLAGGVVLCVVPRRAAERRIAWAGLAATVVLALLVVNYNTGADPLIASAVDAAQPIARDERSLLWSDAWAMQGASTPYEWWVGHGLGAYAADFPSQASLGAFVFPHNHLLEVLYNSGVLGAAMLAVSLLTLTLALVRYAARTRAASALLALALWASVAAFTFVTFPVLSRYSAYPLAFVVGFGVWWLGGERFGDRLLARDERGARDLRSAHDHHS